MWKERQLFFPFPLPHNTFIPKESHLHRKKLNSQQQVPIAVTREMQVFYFVAGRPVLQGKTLNFPSHRHLPLAPSSPTT